MKSHIWQYKKLSDITDVRDGTHDSPKPSETGYPLVTSKHIINNKIDLSETYLISKEDYALVNKRSKVDQYDLLLGMIGTVGETALIKNQPNFAIKNVGLIKTRNKVLGNYLYYYLTSPAGRNEVIKSLSGSTQKFISLGQLRNLTIRIPQKDIQEKVVSVLSTYDDLIENNEKRIRILEEMAQRLYTEWFVKFKFPGHEKVKMINGIPKEWKEKKIKEIGKVITGKTPSTSKLENFGGDVLFIKTPDLHGNIFILETEQTLSDLGVQSQSLKILPENTVFVSCIGTLGVVAITSKPSQTNQQINAIIPIEKDDYCMLYFFVKSLKKHLIGLGSNGATMGNVNKDKFENIKMFYPDKKIREKFFDVASSLFDEILNIEKQIKNMAKIRDLLIPQLVTGKRVLQ